MAPDFFKPLVRSDGETVSIAFDTWGPNGESVSVRLGFPESDRPTAERARLVDALVASAWQAVWLAAQGKYDGRLAA